MTHFRFFALALTGMLIAAPLMAAEPAAPAAGFTEAQKTEIEKIVRDLLNKDPDVIINAVQNAQRQKAEEADKKAAENVVKMKDKLFDNAKDPFRGNPKGDVRIVAFMDYNCGFCKKAHGPLTDLLKSDKDIKVIYKEFPILAESSKMMAKAALAANKQGKYEQMHDALLTGHANDEAAVMDIAKKLGLDTAKLKKDMEDPEIAAMIASNQELANAIGAHGTPTFIFEEKVIPGAMGLEEMQKLVAELRAKKKS